MTFAEWLDEQMQSRGMSNGELARAAKVGDGTVSSWRGGRREPVPESAQRLAQVFGVSSEDVIKLTKWHAET